MCWKTGNLELRSWKNGVFGLVKMGSDTFSMIVESTRCLESGVLVKIWENWVNFNIRGEFWNFEFLEDL